MFAFFAECTVAFFKFVYKTMPFYLQVTATLCRHHVPAKSTTAMSRDLAQWVDEYFRGNLITSCVMVSVSGKSFGIWRTVLTGPAVKRKVYYARTPERGIAIAKAYIKRHCRTTGKRGKRNHKSQTVARVPLRRKRSFEIWRYAMKAL